MVVLSLIWLSPKNVFAQWKEYIPSGIFDDIQEKAIGMGKLKGKCSEHVDKNLSRNLTLKHLKDDFLMVVEEEFPKYYEEIYQGWIDFLPSDYFLN